MLCRVRLFLLLFIGLLHFGVSNGQVTLPGYTIVNYNSDNALPQNSINNIAFDANGFLWLATEMGVVRFDGRNFREYNVSNSPALVSNRCSILISDEASGKIFIRPQFSGSRILTVTEDHQLKLDSALTANTYTHLGINHVFSYNNLYRKWAARDSGAFGGLFSMLFVNRDLISMNEKQAYVRKDQHYYFLDENTADVRLLSEITGHSIKIEFRVGDVFVFFDTDNHLYAYKDGRPYKIIGSSRLMDLLRLIIATGPYPIQAEVRATTDTKHAFLLHKGDILLLNITDGVLDFETLAANTPIRNINCVIYDERQKTIYAGTATSGLYILKKQEFKRLYFSSDNFVINSLYGQAELSEDKILTSSGVLSRSDRTNAPTPGVYDRVGFLRSSDGHIWYSSYGWLIRSDTAMRTAEKILCLGNVSISGIWVSSIVELPDKDILFSTQLGKLYRVRGTTATQLLDMTALLKNAELIAFRPVSDSECWIGTSIGLYSFDMVRGTLRRMPGLEKATVRAIFKARDGSIWIGTYGQGFYRYDKGRFIRMPMDRDNYLATVHCFMEDQQGYFWLPTNKGLFRVAKNALDSFALDGKAAPFYYYFDKTSGFATNEFNGGCDPCGIVTRDGRFSLPSLDGLIQFRPDSVTVIPADHPIFIDRLAGDDMKVFSGDDFEQDQGVGPVIFSVSSPYFGNPANLHLEYTIRELDDKWHSVPGDGRLVLTGLHKGQYMLSVRKQEGYGRYSYRMITWTIRPYWYETILFRLLAAVVIISILPVILWLRYTRQVKRGKDLEQKVAERTVALADSNRVKEKMISIILHDLRSPLRFLHMLSTHIYDNHRNVPESERDEMLRKFRNATHDLYEFTQDFAVWTNAQKEGFVVRRENLVLRDIVGEVVSLYEPGADMCNNVVLNLVPAAVTLVSDPHILKLIIRNLTDNANKYTLNGEIKIQALQKGGAVRIVITDTGRSMDKELVANILSNAYQTDNGSQGLGYKIILELLAKIHGELFIDTPGKTGNRITLLFRAAAPASIPATKV